RFLSRARRDARVRAGRVAGRWALPSRCSARPLSRFARDNEFLCAHDRSAARAQRPRCRMAGARRNASAALMRALPSPYARLLAEPQRFRFDAAARVLARAARKNDLAELVRFRTLPGLAYPPADIVTVKPRTEDRPL